jgi:hypothetical protein
LTRFLKLGLNRPQRQNRSRRLRLLGRRSPSSMSWRSWRNSGPRTAKNSIGRRSWIC